MHDDATAGVVQSRGLAWRGVAWRGVAYLQESAAQDPRLGNLAGASSENRTTIST